MSLRNVLRRPHEQCGRLKRVKVLASIALVAALGAGAASCSGGSTGGADGGPSPRQPKNSQAGSSAERATNGGGTAPSSRPGTPSGAAKEPKADAPGTTKHAGESAVIESGGSLLRVTVTSRKGKRELLLDQPEFGDSRMVPTYVSLTLKNVGETAAGPMPQIMQGLVPEEVNDAEMMQTAPLPKFKPCTGHATPQSLKPGRTYETCRVAVSKRGHPLAKVIFRGQLGGKYYNRPIVWKM